MTLCTERSRLDVQAVRRHFPLLRTRVHGHPLAYLDNAATTQKPDAVIDRLTTYYRSENANVHRGVHTLSQQATAIYEDARSTVRRFLNAAESREIVFVRGATEGINLVAQSYGRTHVGPGDEVLVSIMEHHSNIVPWQILCAEKGAQLRVIPMTDSGEISLDLFDQLLSERTRLVSIVHVSNVLGVVNPVREMTRLAHRRGIPVLVDGAQAVAHLKVDVQALDCDFYVASGHKMLGPTGIGVLYGKAALLDAMPPYQSGGDMISSVTFERTSYNVLPYKFEAGTPDISGAAGLASAIDFLTGLGLDAIEDWETELVDYAAAALGGVPGLRLIGPRTGDRTGVLSFVVEGVHPHDIGTILDRQGIAIRTGHHCCQPLMERLGLPATARASFAFYNTREDVDRLAAGLHSIEAYLADLYQSDILEHDARPRNLRAIRGVPPIARNLPLCGDHLEFYLQVEQGAVTDASFQGVGCAIAKAAASLLTECVTGKTVEDAAALCVAARELVTAPPDAPAADLGPLLALAGVRQFPARAECACMAADAFLEVLERPALSRL